jgi:hypothetical protein
MDIPVIKPKHGRRALWMLLFVVIATVSMVGPTQAVSGLVAASVTVSETFSNLFAGEAELPVRNSASPGHSRIIEQALMPGWEPGGAATPWAMDDSQLMALIAIPDGSPFPYVTDAAQSRRAGRNQDLYGSNAPGTAAAAGRTAAFAPRGAGGMSSRPVVGQEEILSALTQELGIPDLQSESIAPSVGTDSDRVTHDTGEGGPRIAAFSSPAVGPSPDFGNTDFGPVIDEISAGLGLPSVLSPRELPSRPGGQSDDGTVPDVRASLPGLPATLPNLPAMLPQPHSTLLPLDGDLGAPNDTFAARIPPSVAQIPEPSTVMLLSLGALALARHRRSSRL